jgi:mevalonate kinase
LGNIHRFDILLRIKKMPPSIQKAPGKIILFGEHAVVYGQPAIAVPLLDRQASVTIQPLITNQPVIQIDASDINLQADLASLEQDHPFAVITRLIQNKKNLDHLPAIRIIIRSTIPVASGLGSGAAVSVALTKALLAYLGFPLSPQEISEIAYEAEKHYHGNPSGIDNTVIAYQKGILFQRGKEPQWLTIGKPMTLLIVNSTEQKSTKTMVDLVRQRLENDPDSIQPLIEQIGNLTLQAYTALENGDANLTGTLMTENHHLLQQLGVSTPTLDRLVSIAIQNGALGAKLSGAGGGGNMIALVIASEANRVKSAFESQGFSQVIETILRA